MTRISAQSQQDSLLYTKGKDLTLENASDVIVAQIKVFLKWKLNKVPPGNRQALIQMYLDAPSPPEVIPWSNEKELELRELHSTEINMKETVVAVSTK